jgi:hypothetical protein
MAVPWQVKVPSTQTTGMKAGGCNVRLAANVHRPVEVTYKSASHSGQARHAEEEAAIGRRERSMPRASSIPMRDGARTRRESSHRRHEHFYGVQQHVFVFEDAGA